MSKQHVKNSIIITLVLLLFLSVALVHRHYTSIEGRYVGYLVQRLDRSIRFIELRDGHIHAYTVPIHAHRSDPKYEGVVGSYKPLEHGMYELQYEKIGNALDEPVSVRVSVSFYGLNAEELEVPGVAYQRMYFWSRWWN